MAGRGTEGAEKQLIEAAIKAGVPWILPSEWSPDMADEGIMNDTSFIGKSKKQHRDLIEKSGSSSYIAVCTGFWYEYSLAFDFAYGIDLK